MKKMSKCWTKAKRSGNVISIRYANVPAKKNPKMRTQHKVIVSYLRTQSERTSK